MRGLTQKHTIWGFGLTGRLESRVGRMLSRRYGLVGWSEDAMPGMAEFDAQRPALALLTPAALKAIRKLPSAKNRHIAILPLVLMLEENYSREDLEFSVDSDCAAIIRPDAPKAFFLKKLGGVLDIEAVQCDALRMSREIYLEREILERKNEVLQFLVNFLTKTSAVLVPDEIIRAAFTGLNKLFPVRSLHAAIWNNNEKNPEARMIIAAEAGSQACQAWRDLLMEQMEGEFQTMPERLEISNIWLYDQEENWKNASPDNGHLLYLPLAVASRQIGVLNLLMDMDRSLSRDQALALNSALQYLALSLNNAISFQDARNQADFDALTGLYGRRHFEQRFMEEMEKTRHGGRALSMIFCDLDHFKSVNDTYGHLAGDEVLREAGRRISRVIREYDYAARFGGEEFVILLPRTKPDKAVALAERLRRSISDREIMTSAGPVVVTASLGVSGNSDESKSCGELLREADLALYRAKAGGRNCVQGYTGSLESRAVAS